MVFFPSLLLLMDIFRAEAGPAAEARLQADAPLLQLAGDSEGAGSVSVRSQGKLSSDIFLFLTVHTWSAGISGG